MTLRVTPEAEADIAGGARWYEERQPGLGRAFIDEVGAAFERIQLGPLRYPIVHEVLRRAIVRRFPYSAYFSVSGEHIVVFAVLHQRRSRDVLGARRSSGN